MIKIDGQTYNVPVIKMTRSADVLDKYAERTQTGDLKREILGVYFNYTLSFLFPNDNPYEYQRLWDKLTEPEEFHNFLVYDEKGEYSYKGYITGVKDEIVRVYMNGSNKINYVKCDGLTCNFKAKLPARR